ncbi:TVP38/TMEM64 family membrane protein [Porphyridium purpureum]|uniref:TVP38/TMEM64 family membrane protein n=1 Tax=Porphyridium purpureum TaxID=35688 RepID=A0A5J4Z895_PORPP|nr:TVP38/TMEM64 family membrane protein [Porphyridium purpureum]|eukprot:POR2016..scf295_1
MFVSAPLAAISAGRDGRGVAVADAIPRVKQFGAAPRLVKGVVWNQKGGPNAAARCRRHALRAAVDELQDHKDRLNAKRENNASAPLNFKNQRSLSDTKALREADASRIADLAAQASALLTGLVVCILAYWAVAPDVASAVAGSLGGHDAPVTESLGMHAQISAWAQHTALAAEQAQEQVKEILSLRSIDDLNDFVSGMGWTGLVLYGLVYFVLELVAVPSLPLTVTCGYLFGPVKGFMVISLASTSAAASAFLISRYALRDLVSKWAGERDNFRKIDRAIGREGFKIVLLLRLSPLLPFALSNYLYGLTSVKFLPYVFASQLGMVPGTLAFVIAGSAGKEMTHNQNPFLIGLAVLGTIGAVSLIGRVASDAMKDDLSETTDVEDSDSPRTLPQHPPSHTRQHQETER